MSLDYRIGATKPTMVTLASLGINDPIVTPVHYSIGLDLGSGKQRGGGWLMAEWRWAFLDSELVAKLRAYCPEPLISDDVTIKTVKSGGGMDVYTGVIVWPIIENAVDDDCFHDFVLTFRALVKESST